MRMLKAAALGAAIWAGGSCAGMAEAATFQLEGVTLEDFSGNDSGPLTGTFDYSAGVFSNINIAAPLLNVSWSGQPDFADAESFNIIAPIAELLMEFSATCLTNALPGLLCPADAFVFNENIYVAVSGGATAVVPLPAPLLLFVTGLAGVVGLSRGKRRKRQLAQA